VESFSTGEGSTVLQESLASQVKDFPTRPYDIPPEICRKMLQGASYFEEIEIWRKRQIRKDPIAVGISSNGERYLICRWGMDKLIAFQTIKSRS
jgi:hypothetical protein